MRTVKLKSAGPIPVMKIEVTQLQLGSYSVSIWDADDMNPKEIARGTNDDDIEDEFRIVRTLPELASLDDFTLFWVVWVKALKIGQGARYFVRVTLTQGGHEVLSVEKEGAMTKKFMPFRDDWKIDLT